MRLDLEILFRALNPFHLMYQALVNKSDTPVSEPKNLIHRLFLLLLPVFILAEHGKLLKQLSKTRKKNCVLIKNFMSMTLLFV